jgi:hypothetical protein
MRPQVEEISACVQSLLQQGVYQVVVPVRIGRPDIQSSQGVLHKLIVLLHGHGHGVEKWKAFILRLI